MTLQGKRWISIGLLMTGLLGLTACGGSSDNDDVGTPGLTVFTVTPSAGANGTTSPATAQQVWVAWTINEGTSTSFTLNPDPGYHVANVGGTCGGTLSGNVYTTNAITADCTIEASFALNSYSVTLSAEANGSIQADSTQTIYHGATPSFTVTPDRGFDIIGIDGTCGGTLNGNSYTINAITADCTIIARFNLLPPEEAALTLTPQSIKTFAFSWDNINSETEYRLLENADGSSGFTEIAALPAGTTSYEHVVFLPSRMNASYILEACNSEGCSETAPVLVSGSLADAAGYIKASNTEADDSFGYSVAISADGNTLAVSAYLEDSSATGINGDETNNSTLNSGAVYVFSHSDDIWNQQAIIKPSNTGAFDQFGYSLALAADGNTLAVGARLEDSGAAGINGNSADNSVANSGAAYVFSRSDTDWSQQAYIKASNPALGDEFGYSVALAADGTTLLVGAINESSSASNSGAVYLFGHNGASWNQQAMLKAANAGANHNFGTSVALAADGNTLAVGAINESSNATGINGDGADNSAINSGAVYVFSRSDANWSQQAYVKASNTGAADSFGSSVALANDGNTLAVGAINESSSATGINGDEADDSTISGAVYLFSRNDADWSQQAFIKASNTGPGDSFGHSVALTNDGHTLAVGAINENSSAIGINGDEADDSASNSGAVYLFTLNGADWSQQAYIKASNTGANGQFGTSVALAAEGNTLAVGARGDDSNSGAVYLY